MERLDTTQMLHLTPDIVRAMREELVPPQHVASADLERWLAAFQLVDALSRLAIPDTEVSAVLLDAGRNRQDELAWAVVRVVARSLYKRDLGEVAVNLLEDCRVRVEMKTFPGEDDVLPSMRFLMRAVEWGEEQQLQRRRQTPAVFAQAVKDVLAAASRRFTVLARR